MIKIAAVFFGTMLASAASSAYAENVYPTSELTIIMPFAAGGTADTTARKIAAEFGKKFDMTVVVENRTGASGQVGSNYVAKAKPDGSVLLLMATHHVINPALYKTLPYDTLKDFTPVGLVASASNVFVVHPSVEVKTVEEFIAKAKDEPGKLTFSSNGVGGANHLSGELFKSMAGIDITHVPYEGGSEAMTAVLGGHVSAGFAGLPAVQPNLDGRVLALAVTGLERLEAAPDIPTMDEAGVDGFNAVSWFGLFGPAGLPSETEALIGNALSEILADEEVAGFFRSIGLSPGKIVGDDFKDYIETEIVKWDEVANAAKLEKR